MLAGICLIALVVFCYYHFFHKDDGSAGMPAARDRNELNTDSFDPDSPYYDDYNDYDDDYHS